jgi:DNA-binding IclR family transcriptional regulator
LDREQLLLAPLPAQALLIIEHLREHGRITIREAVRITGANRNTLKAHLRTLVERGLLNLRGSGRGVWYDLR